MEKIKNWKTFLENAEIDKSIKNLSKEEIDFLLKFSHPILRKFMSTDEIKMANLLHKKGVLEKGTSDDKHNNVMYYTDSYILSRL